MTFDEAIALQPPWVQIWLIWLLIGAFVLPATLLIWRKSRIAGIIAILASVAAGFGVGWLFGQLGYVRLLGLPHVLLWTPLALYLFAQIRRPDMLARPRRIMAVVLLTILISLAFDYTDLLRYLLGDRAATSGTA